MQDNMDCNVVKDLLPLVLENLAGEASCKLVEEHLKTCKKCRKEMELLQEAYREEEERGKAFDKSAKRWLRRWKYEMIGMLIGLAAVLVGGVLLIEGSYLTRGDGGEDSSYTIKEHYEAPEDYGTADYQGISPLALFPKADAMTGEIFSYYYDCKGNELYQEYQIYLECKYDEEAYARERERLLSLKGEETGRETVYSEEENRLPCIYAMLYDEGYEYALLSEDEGKIYYIYLQGGIDSRDLAFKRNLLPKDYGQMGYYFETEREPYRIYMTEDEKNWGVIKEDE